MAHAHGSRLAGAATVECFGMRLVLETPVDGLVPAVLARLPSASVSTVGTVREYRYVVHTAPRHIEGFVVRRAGRPPLTAPSVEGAAEMITSDYQRALAHHVTDRLFVHAGAVGWRGHALVLPGRSGSGKSRLVAALLRAGAEYLSDEFAVFDTAGFVHPYPRPLALREWDGTQRRVTAASFGADTATGPTRPGLIAFLRYSAGSRWRPRRLSPGRGHLGLLRHTVAARRRIDVARSILASIASTVTSISAVRGEADDVAGHLLRSLDSWAERAGELR